MNKRPEMTDETKEKLAAFNAKQTDWYAVCRKCGARLTGAPAELAAHRCPDGRT